MPGWDKHNDHSAPDKNASPSTARFILLLFARHSTPFCTLFAPQFACSPTLFRTSFHRFLHMVCPCLRAHRHFSHAPLLQIVCPSVCAPFVSFLHGIPLLSAQSLAPLCASSRQCFQSIDPANTYTIPLFSPQSQEHPPTRPTRSSLSSAAISLQTSDQNQHAPHPFLS
jgi:hypothetical protein